MGEVIIDSTQAANLINDYFTSVYTDEEMSNLPDPVNIFTKTIEESLQTIEFTIAIVQEKLSKMKPNKAPGIDNFNSSMLKGKKRQRFRIIHLIEFIQTNNFHIYSIF
jgi:fumarate hydratase class II